MRVPGSNPTAPTFLGVKMAIFGHIWTQNDVLELLGALKPPKSALNFIFTERRHNAINNVYVIHINIVLFLVG